MVRKSNRVDSPTPRAGGASGGANATAGPVRRRELAVPVDRVAHVPLWRRLVQAGVAGLLLTAPGAAGAAQGGLGHALPPGQTGAGHGQAAPTPAELLRMGVELEVVNITREVAVRVVRDVTGGRVFEDMHLEVADARGRVWQVKRDGSLTHERSAEIVTPILTREELPLVLRVVQALHQAGASVDTSCGIHMHICDEIFTVDDALRLVSLVSQYETAIYDGLAVHATRRMEFARPVADGNIVLETHPPKTREALAESFYGGHFQGLNLANFARGKHTVELRYCNGSTRREDVEHCLRLWVALAEAARSPVTDGRRSSNHSTGDSRVDDVLALCDALDLSPSTCAYMVRNARRDTWPSRYVVSPIVFGVLLGIVGAAVARVAS